MTLPCVLLTSFNRYFTCGLVACPTGNKAEATFTYSTDIGVCSGNGRCLSLRQLSVYVDYVNYFDTPKTEYTDWDADRIYGCVCDQGWTGPACDMMTCPLGDDPNTPGVDEVQILDCLCKTCTGGVYLSLHGEQTPLIPYDAPAALIEYYLEVSYLIDLLGGRNRVFDGLPPRVMRKPHYIHILL